MRLPCKHSVPLLWRAPVWLCSVFLLLTCPMATGNDPGTPITQVSIINPAANEVWLVGTDHVLTCTTSTDQDLICGYPPYMTADSVTHYWTTTAGTFKDNDQIAGNDHIDKKDGYGVTFICPTSAGNITLLVHADDDCSEDNNTAIVDETETSASMTLSVVGLEVYQVGFGNDHPLHRTATGDGSDGGWTYTSSSTPIADPVYDADDTPEEKAAKNHACFTKGASNPSLVSVRCRTPVALTEYSEFSVRALGTNSWDWTAFYISAGNRESEIESISLADNTLASTVKRYDGNYTCEWKYCCPTGYDEETALNTTSHSVYLTYDTPDTSSDSLIIVKRINWVCATADGKTTAREVADAIHTALNADPPLDGKAEGATYTEAWALMSGGNYRGHCDDQARFMVRALKLAGCTGTAYNTYASTDATVDVPQSKLENGKTWWLKFDFDRNGAYDNQMEGSLESAGHYYAVWPSLDAASKVNLLRKVGPDGANAHQLWVRTANDLFNGTLIETDPNPVGYPAANP